MRRGDTLLCAVEDALLSSYSDNSTRYVVSDCRLLKTSVALNKLLLDHLKATHYTAYYNKSLISKN